MRRPAVALLAAVWVLVAHGCAAPEQSKAVTEPAGFQPVVEAAVVVSETKMDGRRGKTHGIISFENSPYGLVITPKLHGLDPGAHAAHVHENASCAADDSGVPAGAAGDHYDPHASGKHTGPYGEGHLGDLPNLHVEPNGMAYVPVLAPRVTVADLRGRSLMIHAGADRYDEYAEHEHGKGGMRMYCGIIR